MRKRFEHLGLKYVEQWKNQLVGIEEEVKRMAEGVAKLASEGFPESFILGDHELHKDPSETAEPKSLNANLECDQCFLYSAFYPENKEISREELIRYIVDEGLINGMKSSGAQFSEGNAILDELEKKRLLEGGTFDMEEQYRRNLDDLDCKWLKGRVIDPELKWVKMCCDSKAKAISIMKEHSGLMVEAGLKLTEIAHERKWASMEKVSLMCNSIKKIPWGTSLKCPKLSTLILQQNPLQEIPNTFSDMPALRVLDLSYTDIKSLPNSISNLESLNSLLLKSCQNLQNLPAMGKLQGLRRLDLSRTAIMELPEGLETLINLMWLSFYKCEKLDMEPRLLIPKLTNLRYLVLDCNRYGFMKVKADDLKGLKKLETFLGNLYSTSDFNTYVKSMQDVNLRPKNYLLQLGSGNPWNPSFGRAVIFINCDMRTGKESLVLPVDVEQLYITGCHRWGCVCDDLSYNNSTNLKFIDIFECDFVENIFCSSDLCPLCHSLQNLVSLNLACLPNLRFLWRQNEAPSCVTLSGLRFLKVADCDNIKMLFTPQMLEELPNLEKILVKDCGSMEEVFPVTGRESMVEPSSEGNNDGSNHLATFCLPKLVSLELWNLRQLTSVCGGTMDCKCPKLKSWPRTVPWVDMEFAP